MLHYIKSRKVKIPKQDLLVLLLNDDVNTPPLIESLSQAAQLAVQDLEKGSFILIVDCEIDDGPSFTIELIGWRGNTSVKAYIGLNERIHYLRMCGQDVSKYGKKMCSPHDFN